MSRFDTYFLMKEADVIEYVKAKYPDFFAPEAVLTVKEIGDGNLNYVFRVVEEATGKSIIVKQAGVSLRISAEMKVSTDRNRIESEILQIQDKYAPGLVPKIYGYDTVMCACGKDYTPSENEHDGGSYCRGKIGINSFYAYFGENRCQRGEYCRKQRESYPHKCSSFFPGLFFQGISPLCSRQKAVTVFYFISSCREDPCIFP